MKHDIRIEEGQVRSFHDPNNPKIKIVHAFVNINDLPNNLPLDPDPRVPKQTGEVPKRILISLLSNDGRFHLKNRGITISARKAEFDNRTRVLTLDIPDGEEAFGILDGAHTYDCIMRGIEQERPTISDRATTDDARVLEKQYVHLEIMEKVQGVLADIAEARNFSVALKAWTLANYRDKFNWLLDAFGRSFSKKVIRVSENDPQPVGILEVIQVIAAVNPFLFEKEKPAQDAYKNSGKMLQAFIADGDRHGFRKMEPICIDVMRLFDHIRLNWKKHYNALDEAGRRSRYGSTRESQEAKVRRTALAKATYYFTSGRLDTNGRFVLDAKPVEGNNGAVDKGNSIPVISGFRVLLRERHGKLEWITDPFEFFDTYGAKLLGSFRTTIENAEDNSAIGRDPQVYRQMTSDVRRWYLESQFEQR